MTLSGDGLLWDAGFGPYQKPERQSILKWTRKLVMEWMATEAPKIRKTVKKYP